MNREVHVRFWESAGLRCPAPLDYLKDCRLVSEARLGIENWIEFYNHRRPHQRLAYRTPAVIYKEGGVD